MAAVAVAHLKCTRQPQDKSRRAAGLAIVIDVAAVLVGQPPRGWQTHAAAAACLAARIEGVKHPVALHRAGSAVLDYHLQPLRSGFDMERCPTLWRRRLDGIPQ